MRLRALVRASPDAPCGRPCVRAAGGRLTIVLDAGYVTQLMAAQNLVARAGLLIDLRKISPQLYMLTGGAAAPEEISADLVPTCTPTIPAASTTSDSSATPGACLLCMNERTTREAISPPLAAHSLTHQYRGRV